VRAWRRAKLVVLDLDSEDRIVVQPRFTGALLLSSGPLPEHEAPYSTCDSPSTTGATSTIATFAASAPSP
jgi:hypothetical protein